MHRNMLDDFKKKFGLPDDFEFEFDENAPEHFEYYLLGERPIRATVSNDSIILTETIDLDTKTFGIDNIFIPVLLEATDDVVISEADFINQCLKYGVKPPQD